MTLAEKIQTELIGSRYDSATEMEAILTQIVGENVSWYDSNIDDGVDDDETEDMYVMRDAFSTDDNKINIRIYYGDMTGEITYVSVN